MIRKEVVNIVRELKELIKEINTIVGNNKQTYEESAHQNSIPVIDPEDQNKHG